MAEGDHTTNGGGFRNPGWLTRFPAEGHRHKRCSQGSPIRAAALVGAAAVMVRKGEARAEMKSEQNPFDHNAMAGEIIRVLIAKVGLDGHDRGVKIVARCLRDAGMDVIYTGLHRTPEEVVTAAVQEDADILGISILSGAQLTVFPRVIDLLKQHGAEDMILLAGGVMPGEDVAALKAIGVAEILLQDTPPEQIVATVRRLVAERGPR